MFPWMMPNATMGGQLSLLQMMMQPYPQRQPFDDRSDQTPRGNQPDRGNAMAPPGQTPPGGPDDNPQSGYDYNTVSPGWGAPSWMRMLQGVSNPRGGNNQQRGNPLQMSLLGLSMLQPRPPTHTGPYPWI